MKKIILSVAAMLTFGFVNAQEVEFGVKAGVNIASITGDVEDVSAKIGFHIGGFAEIKISEKFSVQPELLFSTQGAKSEYTYNEGGFTEKSTDKLNLNYINIPVMAKLYVAEGFSLEAGPQIGFLMSSKTKSDYTITGGGMDINESVEVDSKEFTNTVDFGLNFGLGYKFTENLSAGARYNLGLSDINKEVDGEALSVKNSVIQVSIGYSF
ncbi:porin family protein [Flavobacterium ardleyense]|uniref:porin family protein n=1 Tax=Flavobacterium ardleyense TaxID=2038737 RepID=UPI00298D02B1|nr:porin family protein [Flavobacterium ardleyense]